MNPLAHDCANCAKAIRRDLVVGRHETEAWTCEPRAMGFPVALACPYYLPRGSAPMTPIKES